MMRFVEKHGKSLAISALLVGGGWSLGQDAPPPTTPPVPVAPVVALEGELPVAAPAPVPSAPELPPAAANTPSLPPPTPRLPTIEVPLAVPPAPTDARPALPPPAQPVPAVPAAPPIPPGDGLPPPVITTVPVVIRETSPSGLRYGTRTVIASPNVPLQHRYRTADAAADGLSAELKARIAQGNVQESDRKALKDNVRQAFESRQELLRQEIAEYRSRLDHLQRMLDDRDGAKEAIIERRVDELLKPNLHWDPAPAAGNQPNSFQGPHPVPSPYRVPSADARIEPTQPDLRPRAANKPAAKIEMMQAPLVGVTPRPSTTTARTPSIDSAGWSNSAATPARPPVPTGSADQRRPSAKVFPLKFARADALATTLQTLSGEEALNIRVSADQATNSLIVLAHPAELEVVTVLISQLDVDSASPSIVVPTAPRATLPPQPGTTRP